MRIKCEGRSDKKNDCTQPFHVVGPRRRRSVGIGSDELKAGVHIACRRHDGEPDEWIELEDSRIVGVARRPCNIITRQRYVFTGLFPMAFTRINRSLIKLRTPA